jgi:low affinity Fe/Cu permease
MTLHSPASPGRTSWSRVFDRMAGVVTRASGSPSAFALAVLVVLVWGCTGPLFGYSETWQLVINTGTTIVTFLMVFIIQHAQNKDSVALHLKLNELIASHRHASNRLVAIEDLDEQELQALRAFYQKLSLLAQKDSPIERSHSMNRARRRHSLKIKSQTADTVPP